MAARRSSCTSSPATTASRSRSPRRRSSRRSANVSRIREAARRLSRGRLARSDLEPLRERSSTRSPATSTRPRRWRRSTSGSARPTGPAREPAGDSHLREMLEVLGLDSAARRGSHRRPRRCASWRRQREHARRARDFATADRLRDEIAALGLGGTRRADGLRAAAAVILYGRNPVREALRGRRAGSVGEVWATRRRRSRAVACGRAGEDGGRGGDRAPLRLERRTRACAPTPGAYPLRERRGAAGRARIPWWWRSTRSRTRRTSARSAAPPSASARPAWSSPSAARRR